MAKIIPRIFRIMGQWFAVQVRHLQLSSSVAGDARRELGCCAYIAG
jgi:hypothetical protein